LASTGTLPYLRLLNMSFILRSIAALKLHVTVTSDTIMTSSLMTFGLGVSPLPLAHLAATPILQSAHFLFSV
jgi:hypothetical protein